jgi:Ser-tRNA(Ala) deacylase AlaX
VSDRESGKITYQISPEHDLKIGDVVIMKIDKDLRIRNAKLHSAGHILDLATQRLKLPW